MTEEKNLKGTLLKLMEPDKGYTLDELENLLTEAGACFADSEEIVGAKDELLHEGKIDQFYREGAKWEVKKRKPYFLEYYYDKALLHVDFNQLHEIFWTMGNYGVENCNRGKRGGIIFGEKKEVIALKKRIKKELGIDPDDEGYKLKKHVARYREKDYKKEEGKQES